MNIRPYVGITDFINFDQVLQMFGVYKKHKKAASERMLHVGVMMSYKTLAGIESKFSKVFPPKEKIASIFGCTDKDVYNCLHYADYGNQPTFVTDMYEALECAGDNLHAVQLDMTWPDPEDVWAMRYAASREEDLEIILQVGTKAIELAGGTPEGVVEKLKGYKGNIQRVLLDKSLGKGIGMDAVGLAQYAIAIRSTLPNLGLVFAGGLGPDTLDLLRELPQLFPDLSVDAQGKLRPSGSNLDPIDWDMAGTYLAKALELLK